ncbi:hypothetical protein [Microvirga sp. Mcv34]|uniref:hypothetical protein n=1 Tax=Microvirga sp. Mcv34 TaxID=2926016 RepID=UPI0021CAA818|nr:hypothetical protein [Microvirga sp. Mcv34]
MMIVELDLPTVLVVTWTMVAVRLIEAPTPVPPLNDNLLIAVVIPVVGDTIVPSFCLSGWEHATQC